MTVTAAGESCRKNFEITCSTDHFSLCFWSGSRKNQVVLLIDDGGEIRQEEIRTGWGEWLRQAWRRF